MGWTVLAVVVLLAEVGVPAFLRRRCFGGIPLGDRLERVRNSPNYYEGQFHNLEPTMPLTMKGGYMGILRNALFRRQANSRPKGAVPSVKNDLWKLARSKNALVWFGHSSYLLQIDGKRLLVDPVLSGAGSPVSFVNRPFRGADAYRPKDIPEIDYLVISHDHWDHLDYATVTELRGRIGKVVCGLGVGQHFERWGFDPKRIVELDWNEDTLLEEGLHVHCLPARHFSGRGLKRNRSLWASYLFDFPSRSIFIGGDGGYGKHFAEIGARFKINLAILENGQYSDTWKYIHTRPQYLVREFRELKAERLFTVHHSKFSLSGQHAWNEPLENVADAAERENINLMQPMIGEIVDLDNGRRTVDRWWSGVDGVNLHMEK